jgi:hypothetical protein
VAPAIAEKQSGPVAEAIATAKKHCADYRARAKANALPGQKPPKLTAALVEKFVRQALEPQKEAILTQAVEQVAAQIEADPE